MAEYTLDQQIDRAEAHATRMRDTHGYGHDLHRKAERKLDELRELGAEAAADARHEALRSRP